VFTFHKHTLLELTPYGTISWLRPDSWSADKGVIAGTFVGLCVSFLSSDTLISRVIFKSRDLAGMVFSRFFVRLIPFYILGFLLELRHSGLLMRIVETYSAVIPFIVLSLALYGFVLFSLASINHHLSFKDIIKNVWPSGVIAFTSMSSAATMPFTILAAEKNLKTPSFAKMIIPATTNIQQIGDCIANALLCLVILKNFGKPIPDFWTWSMFLTVFVLARYTTAAVLGGAIFIMVPIYERYLGFTSEMTALIIALNVVLDPLITSSNVLANGALAILFEKVWLFIRPHETNTSGHHEKLIIEDPFTRERARKMGGNG
jgi:Na+/H+-dicarboxylate symporter